MGLGGTHTKSAKRGAGIRCPVHSRLVESVLVRVYLVPAEGVLVTTKSLNSCGKQSHVHLAAICKVELTLRLIGAEREAGGVCLWGEFLNVCTGILFI